MNPFLEVPCVIICLGCTGTENKGVIGIGAQETYPFCIVGHLLCHLYSTHFEVQETQKEKREN
jgi:hypothetical protein